jgi:hypothetical protein
MFPVVAARLICEDPKDIVKTVIKIMQDGTKKDVEYMLVAREKAWATSEKQQQKAQETSYAKEALLPFEFYRLLAEEAPPESSSRQWSQHYMDGLPWLQQQLDYLQNHLDEPILDRIKQAFDPVRSGNPETKVGILADMCAAAVFLHLSFTE